MVNRGKRKTLTLAKVWCHTCGSCVGYIPDLIENVVTLHDAAYEYGFYAG